MIPKVDTGFRTRSCSVEEIERVDESKKSHPALTLLFRGGERRKALLKVGDEVGHVLESDVKANGRPARCPGRRGAEARAIEGNGETFVAAPGGADPEQRQGVEKGVRCRLGHRLEHDGEQARCAGEVAAPQGVSGIFRARRME